MSTKMHNPKTGETVRVPGRRVKDHLQNGFEIADGSEVPEGNVTADEANETTTKAELYERAQELDIEGRSTMDKNELEKAIEEAEDAEDDAADSGSVEAETGADTGAVVESGTDATSTNVDTRYEKGVL